MRKRDLNVSPHVRPEATVAAERERCRCQHPRMPTRPNSMTTRTHAHTSTKIQSLLASRAHVGQVVFSGEIVVPDAHPTAVAGEGGGYENLARAEGLVGGSLSVEEIRSIAADVGENLTETLDAVVVHNADLDPDAGGICQGISVTLKMDLTSVHLYQ